MKPTARINLDRVGAYASAICAVHCVLTGLALGLLSVMGLGFIGSPTTEMAFLATAVLIGTAAVVHGVRKHHSWIPSMLFVAGLACWLSGHFLFGHAHEAAFDPAKGGVGTLFSVLGGLCIVSFHVLNRRLQHRCACDHCLAGQ